MREEYPLVQGDGDLFAACPDGDAPTVPKK